MTATHTRAGEIQKPQGSIRGLLQVNAATTHFWCRILKGVSNDVVICCLIVGIAEGNLWRHYMRTHKNAAEEETQRWGKAAGKQSRGKYNKIQTLSYPRKSHILMQGPIPLLVATVSFVEPSSNQYHYFHRGSKCLHRVNGGLRW